MNRVHSSSLKFNGSLSIVLALLTSIAFLTACSKPQEPAYLSFSPYSSHQLQKTSARSIHDSELGLTSFIVDIKTINNKRVKQFDILNFVDDQINIEVPPNVALVVSGLGFVENQKKYEGQVLVNPVRPGKKRSANLILYDVENQNNEIQVDIAFDKESAANGRSKGVRFSRDNNYVLFFSDSTNLISEDANDTVDIFLKNLAAVGTTDTENLHADDLGILGISEQSKIVEGADISEDGVYVVFSSDAANLVPDDTNEVSDVFLKNTVSGAIERISVIDGEQKSTGSFNPQISDDGLFVSYFHQSGESADTASIFLYHRILKTRVSLPITSAHYVLSGNGRWIVYQNLDLQLVMYNISEKREFIIAEEALGYMFNITQNGDFVAFIPELAGNEYAKSQFYLFSRNNQTAVKLSRTLSGGNISENLTQSSPPAVSGDGSYVAFSYDDTIYVRELRNQNFTKVVQGNDPFISKNGARIGYSRGDNLFFVDNPLYLERAISGKASAPADLQITPVSGGFELSWQAAQGADYYRIYQTTSVGIAENRENSEFDAVIRESNETSIIITDNLLNNTSYYFVVAAVNQQGEGVLSNEVGALTEFDEIPPTVDTITSPATNPFTISSQVNIQFSENISPETANDSNIRLLDSSDNEISVSVTSSNEFVYLNSASPLLFGADYKVNISSAITDIAGNRLASDFLDSFTTWAPIDEGTALAPIQLNEGRYQGMVHTGTSYYNFSVIGAEKDIYAFIVSNASNPNISTSSDASPHPLQNNTYLFRTFEASITDVGLTVNGSDTLGGAIYSIDVIGIDDINAGLGGNLNLATLSNIAPEANINLSNLIPSTAYVLDLSPFIAGQIEIRSLFDNSTFCQISSANQLCEFIADANGEITLTITGISNFDGLLVTGTLHAVSEINISPLATEYFDFLLTSEPVNYYKITGLDTTQYVLNLLISSESSTTPSINYEISTQH